jgi:hypothetical protein
MGNSIVLGRHIKRGMASRVQFPFSNLSVNCDIYKVAIIWAIIAHEFDVSLNRNLHP